MLIKKKHKIQQEKGIATLLIIVIIGAAVLIMAFSSSILGLGDLNMAYTAQKGKEAFYIADGCVEEALRRLKIDSLYTGDSLNLGSGSCIISIESAGDSRDILIIGEVDDYQKRLEINATISNGIISINSWEEI